MRRLVLEGGPELGLLQRRHDFLRDAAGEIDTALGHEHQRQIAGNTAEIGGEQGQRFRRDRIRAGKSRAGHFRRLGEKFGLTLGAADGTVDVHNSTAGKQFLGRNPADGGARIIDRRQEGPDGIVARRARADIDMAALARHRKPFVLCMHEAGDAEAGARPQHDARGECLPGGGADRLAMLVSQRADSQPLRFEIVDDQHIRHVEIGDHLARTHHPGAIGQRDVVAIDRPGDRKNGRARLDRGLVEHGSLDRVFDGREIGGLDDGKRPRIAIGVLENRKASIGAADIANEDRKRQVQVGIEWRLHVIAPHRHCFRLPSRKNRPRLFPGER